MGKWRLCRMEKVLQFAKSIEARGGFDKYGMKVYNVES